MTTGFEGNCRLGSGESVSCSGNSAGDAQDFTRDFSPISLQVNRTPEDLDKISLLAFFDTCLPGSFTCTDRNL